MPSVCGVLILSGVEQAWVDPAAIRLGMGEVEVWEQYELQHFDSSNGDIIGRLM